MILTMILGFAGGLALFMVGMRIMSRALQETAGERLRCMLGRATDNRFSGLLVGAGVTAAIQSSSATSVLVVGLVNAGLLTLTQAAGVIVGMNIGTTVTAQLVAFQLTDIAFPAAVIGAAGYFLGRSDKVRRWSRVLLGFGVLFLGMRFMVGSVAPLREMAWFQDAYLTLDNRPAAGVLVGLSFTALVQSSSATIGVLQALSARGLMDISVALPVLIGDNIGTCVTALLASVGAGVAARRAAVIHLLFNVVGACIFLLCIPLILPLLHAMGGDPVRQIAHAHTLFNVLNAAIQLPFIGLLVLAARILVPGPGGVRTGTVVSDYRPRESGLE